MTGFRALAQDFGAEVTGFEARFPLDPPERVELQDAFDRFGLLVFRDIELDNPGQIQLSKMLVRRDAEADGGSLPDDPTPGNWYVSNEKEDAAAPYGRLQFHADGMWAKEPFEVISLYGQRVEQPAVPTTFVSAVRAWKTLPDDLRARIAGLEVLHTAGAVGRGDLADVLPISVERAPTTVKPLVLSHPRTGVSLLYACEQMTREVVGLDPRASEDLLTRLFAHMCDPPARLDHHWRERDFVVWDNIAVQHARPNVSINGPKRTLRKAAHPLPHLERDEMPTYSATR
jgi:alpha-ketoglutarate-dependent taurine dioxygenase